MTKKQDRRPVIIVGGASAMDRVRRAGGNPIACQPFDVRLAEAASSDKVHGLLLLGGGDVNPERYGLRRDGTVYGVSDDRDASELLALDEAVDRGLPTLGICRGAQLINVHAGGTLHLDIERDTNASRYHGGGHDHRVTATPGSRLARAWAARGAASERFVVSFHHQAVSKLGEGLEVTAVSRDGIVEAIESSDPSEWALGVQFHPEMASNAYSQRIFDEFVRAAAKFADLPVPVRAKPVRVPEMRKATTAKAKAPRKARVYSSTRGGPVNVSWRCFRGCNIRFDLEDDYMDHMVMLHGEELEMIDR